MIIAIDGPAGSGKSSTARAVAQQIGAMYLDTGAMYRAVALRFLQAEAIPSEAEAERLLVSMRLEVRPEVTGNRLFLDGVDVSDLIRTPEVSQMSSIVSALPAVRSALVREQRQIAHTHSASDGDVILDGRDIGTVVFPDADLKIFMVADLDVRARRRYQELVKKGTSDSLDEVQADMDRRDQQDQSRALAPLRMADDALALDTTDVSFLEQVAQVVEWIKQKHQEQQNIALTPSGQ